MAKITSLQKSGLQCWLKRINRTEKVYVVGRLRLALFIVFKIANFLARKKKFRDKGNLVIPFPHHTPLFHCPKCKSIRKEDKSELTYLQDIIPYSAKISANFRHNENKDNNTYISFRVVKNFEASKNWNEKLWVQRNELIQQWTGLTL